STPNLLTRFVEGVATAATNPGATGGATAKTTAGHQHTSPSYLGGDRLRVTDEWGTESLSLQHEYGTVVSDPFNSSIAWRKVKSNTDSISDIRPLFYAIAFLMKT
ncbi:unnamed protein product, partial [marine sediment metagenome]